MEIWNEVQSIILCAWTVHWNALQIAHNAVHRMNWLYLLLYVIPKEQRLAWIHHINEESDDGPKDRCYCMFPHLSVKMTMLYIEVMKHVSNLRSELQSSLEYTDVFNMIKRQCQKVICVILKYNLMAHLSFIWTGDNYEQLKLWFCGAINIIHMEFEIF